jgi:hypothetical protein
MRPYRRHPERFLRDHTDDDGLCQALAEGTRAAITVAMVGMRDKDGVALDQLRATLRR